MVSIVYVNIAIIIWERWDLWFPQWLWCAIMEFGLFPATVCHSTHLFVRNLLVNGPFYREYIWHILNYTHIFWYLTIYFATVRVYNQPSHVVTIGVLIWHMLVARWMPASWTFRTTVSTRSSTRRGCMVHLDRQSSCIVVVVMFFSKTRHSKVIQCLGCLGVNWWWKQKLPSFHIVFAHQTWSWF